MGSCKVCGGVLTHEAYSGTMCWPCAEVHAEKPPSAFNLLARRDLPRVAMIVACLPFALHFSITQTFVDHVEHLDYVALLLGPVAVVLGFLSAYTSHRDTGDVSNQAAFAILIGIAQTVRAFYF